jgi:hypothetical protein
MTERSLLFAASLAAVLLVPGAAQAATFPVCAVAAPQCPNTSVQAALGAAAAAPGPDKVQIGPGVFTSENGFLYLAKDATNAVEIAGAGDATVLRATPTDSDAGVTALAVAGPGTSVHDLRLELEPGGSYDSKALSIGEGFVDRVSMSSAGEGVITWSTPLRHVRIEAERTGVLGYAFELEDSTVTAALEGVYVALPDSRPTSIERTRITGGYGGVTVVKSAVELHDSVVRLTQSGVGLQVSDGGTDVPGKITGTHVTVVGAGGGTGAKATGTGAGGATIVLSNSLLTGFGTAGQRVKPSQAAGATGVAFSHTVLPLGGSVGGVVEDQVLRLDDPGFAGAADGDYTLAAGSPALDTAPAAPGAPATDLLGRARPADGDGNGSALADPGAFERPAPVAGDGGTGSDGGSGGGTGGGEGGVPPAGDTTPPAITELAVKRRPRRVRFVLSEPARATITVARRRGGRWRGVKVVTREAPAGAARVRLRSLSPGRYRVGVQAVDAAGNRSAVVREPFRVR